MANKTFPAEEKLLNKPLAYFNFTNRQKLHAYEYLLGSAQMPHIEPVFDAQTLDILDEYGQSVRELLEEANKHSRGKAKKLQEIALIKAYKNLYETGSVKPLMAAVEAVYGLPDEDLFWRILNEALEQARANSSHKKELAEVEKLVRLRRETPEQVHSTARTRAQVFQTTQEIFKKVYAEETALLRTIVVKKPAVHRYHHQELIELFDALLKFYKLDREGWVIALDSRTERVMVNYESKSINVSRGSFRLSRSRAIGWALHEVAVHAHARKSIALHAKALGERRVVEEGLGIFVEQMVFRRFQPVRSLRYIALGLALGIDGKPRNAKEVYEIIWRLRFLGGVAKSEEIAKEYAAKEVIRVFRGMPLNQKGVVITKDRAYIEGNQAVWAHIENNGPELIFEMLGKKI